MRENVTYYAAQQSTQQKHHRNPKSRALLSRRFVHDPFSARLSKRSSLLVGAAYSGTGSPVISVATGFNVVAVGRPKNQLLASASAKTDIQLSLLASFGTMI